MIRILSNNRGSTVVEYLVAALITGIVAAASFNFYIKNQYFSFNKLSQYFYIYKYVLLFGKYNNNL